MAYAIQSSIPSPGTWANALSWATSTAATRGEWAAAVREQLGDLVMAGLSMSAYRATACRTVYIEVYHSNRPAPLRSGELRQQAGMRSNPVAEAHFLELLVRAVDLIVVQPKSHQNRV